MSYGSSEHSYPSICKSAINSAQWTKYSLPSKTMNVWIELGVFEYNPVKYHSQNGGYSKLGAVFFSVLQVASKHFFTTSKVASDIPISKLIHFITCTFECERFARKALRRPHRQNSRSCVSFARCSRPPQTRIIDGKCSLHANASRRSTFKLVPRNP